MIRLVVEHMFEECHNFQFEFIRVNEKSTNKRHTEHTFCSTSVKSRRADAITVTGKVPVIEWKNLIRS